VSDSDAEVFSLSVLKSDGDESAYRSSCCIRIRCSSSVCCSSSNSTLRGVDVLSSSSGATAGAGAAAGCSNSASVEVNTFALSAHALSLAFEACRFFSFRSSSVGLSIIESNGSPRYPDVELFKSDRLATASAACSTDPYFSLTPTGAAVTPSPVDAFS